jgi:TonB family protein
MAAGVVELPGVLTASALPSTDSLGPGAGPGAGGGRGTGIGPGDGPGLGDGSDGGTGGGAFEPGNGVTSPQLVRETKPNYTGEAMRAKVQGAVWLEAIVLPDGSVGTVQVTRSLDPRFGLDQEAIRTVKQWRFLPGMRGGKPVPVRVAVEMAFTLR